MGSNVCPDRAALQQLSKHEIDRRLAMLAADLVDPATGLGDAASDPLRPRWMSPAELVRRMRPFLVWN